MPKTPLHPCPPTPHSPSPMQHACLSSVLLFSRFCPGSHSCLLLTSPMEPRPTA